MARAAAFSFAFLLLAASVAVSAGPSAGTGPEGLPAAVLSGREAEYPMTEGPRPAGAVPVFAGPGGPGDLALDRFGTGEVLLRLAPGAALDAADLAVEALRHLRGGFWAARVADPFAVTAESERLQGVPGVASAEPMLQKLVFPRLVPNDPRFDDQWHLRNTGQGGGSPGLDVGAVQAWDTATGAGVTISIVDDGVQYVHPDLDDRFDLALSDDPCGGDGNPTPGSGDHHGTAVAGVAAAVGGNGLGVAGVAFDANLAAVRLTACFASGAEEAAALSDHNDRVDIYTNSWGPFDSPSVTDRPQAVVRSAIADSVANGRGGLGNLYTWAGGNGHPDDHGNYDGYANSRYVVAVGAVANDGDPAWYSEACACLLVSAPSDGGSRGIVTTDRTGNPGYSNGDVTNDFGGTSAAAPVVAGVIALMLEANPGLGWRDVHAILAETASRDGLAPSGWMTNGAGFHVHDRYGFGLVDAAAAVDAAVGWANRGPEASSAVSWSGSQSIPDGDGRFPSPGQARTFQLELTDDLTIERVALDLSATHGRHNDLRVRLTSPDGTTSTMLSGRDGGSQGHFSRWTTTSTQFYGESAAGTWTVTVEDLRRGTAGTVTFLELTAFGHGGGAANAAPTADAGADQVAGAGDLVNLDGTGSTDPDGDLLTYRWTQVRGPVVTLDDPDAATPSFTAPSYTRDRRLAFDLVVDDGILSSPADRVRIDILADTGGNQAPTADAGLDQTVTAGDTVHLDGTGSSDPDGDPLAFEWRQTRGPAVTLAGATTDAPSFTAPDVTERTILRIALRVNDGTEDSRVDVVRIRVQPAP
ncbi:MAG: S8 family serine peptidase [Thermoplasmatota archaeon]